MTSLAGIFIFNGLVWWIIAGSCLLGMWITEEQESYGSSFFCLLFLGFLVQIKYHIFQGLLLNPTLYIYVAISYLFIGGVWSIFKWYLYSLSEAERVIESTKNYLSKRDNETDENYNNRKLDNIRNSTPVASKNKEKITAWICYWPLNLVWTCINDLVKRVIDKIYDLLENLYNSISKSVFNKALAKFSKNVSSS
jgi:hypothetical protein